MNVKGSGGVLCTAIAELFVGLILLIIYEAKYITAANRDTGDDKHMATGTFNSVPFSVNYTLPSSKFDTNGVTISTPLDFVFYLSILINIFAVAGLFGVVNAIKELVMIFFGWNAVQMLITFYFFVDIATVAGLNYLGSSGSANEISRAASAAAAFMFFAFMLSILATFYGIKTLKEYRNREKEDALAINMANTALNNI